MNPENDDNETYEETVTNTNGSINTFISPWGRLMRELIEPSIIDLFKARGRECYQFASGIISYRQDPPIKISMIANDDEEIIAVDFKSRLSYEDVDQFISKLERFKFAFSRYENFRLYGAIAGIYINSGVDRYACEKGLFMMKLSGDTVEIINDANFKVIAY
jgi:hypothetical protein